MPQQISRVLCVGVQMLLPVVLYVVCYEVIVAKVLKMCLCKQGQGSENH